MRKPITITVRRGLLVPCLLALASCATIRAGSDHYSEADFSDYRRYAWIDESPLIRSDSSRIEISPLSLRRIREAIERELGAKGFELIGAREQADFAISFTVGARDTIGVNDYPAYYRGPWRWQGPYFGRNVDVNVYTEGTLAIDVFDNATRQPVWHGWARKRITEGDVDDPAPTINAAVQAILAEFPPG
jgi:hypothetical protein